MAKHLNWQLIFTGHFLNTKTRFKMLIRTIYSFDAGPQELMSFVGNFSHPWKIGFEADLHLRCFAGQAYITLKAGLGHVQPHPYHGHHHKHVRPSQLRRRLRREKERKEAAKANTKESSEINEVNENETVDEAVRSKSFREKDTGYIVFKI